MSVGDFMDKDPSKLNFLGRLTMFQAIRRRIYDLAEQLDLAGSNFEYHLKNEPAIRIRVKELQQLIGKLEETLGPEGESTAII